MTITLNLNYLVDTTVEERPREVESLLGSDGPVPTQVQSINKKHTFSPALKTLESLIGLNNYQIATLHIYN